MGAIAATLLLACPAIATPLPETPPKTPDPWLAATLSGLLPLATYGFGDLCVQQLANPQTYDAADLIKPGSGLVASYCLAPYALSSGLLYAGDATEAGQVELIGAIGFPSAIILGFGVGLVTPLPQGTSDLRADSLKLQQTFQFAYLAYTLTYVGLAAYSAWDAYHVALHPIPGHEKFVWPAYGTTPTAGGQTRH